MTRVAVLYGGISAEREVSISSGEQVIIALRDAGFDVSGIDVGEDLTAVIAALTPRPDAVFNALHGRFGEDGAIQGVLSFSGIPYVGCDIQSSALCMDKSLAYMVARNAGIAVPRFRTVRAGERVVGAGERIDDPQLAYPLFVKPARSGSSFGVTRVSGPEELEDAIDNARRYDSKILIEEAVPGIEVGCAILGSGDELLCGEVDRIALSHGFFRIHQEEAPEQGSDNAKVIVPADISADARALVQESARTVYRALGCSGLSRIDMFLTADGRVVLNEVNTLPGLTSYSRYPRMMAAAGLSFADMIDRIVSEALARVRR
jgi:D-alanine---(R)-lactate ligase